LAGGLFAILGVVGFAQTWLVEVSSVDEEAGLVEVAYLRSPEARPTELLAAPHLFEALRLGAVGRLNLGFYENRWWIDAWWPLSAEATARLSERAWWPPDEGASELPAGGILGLGPKGELVDLRSDAFRLGCFVVPLVHPSEAEGRPGVIERVIALAERLSTTPHRDLPIILWSLEPEKDGIRQVRQWAEGLGEGSNFFWVSVLSEWQPVWCEHFSVLIFQVAGRSKVTNPLLLALDGDGQLIARYEGWNWPIDRLVGELDEALLSSPE
jgi:hypothetical protein